MLNSRPPSNNRLLALEQELLEKKRLTKARQCRRDIDCQKGKSIIAGNQDLPISPLNLPTLGDLSSIPQDRGAKSTEFPNSCEKRHTNNQLLELEQELLRRYSKKANKKTSGGQNFKAKQNDRIANGLHYPSNNRLLELEQELLRQKPQPKKQKPKSKSSWVKSQVFDTGEPITLQYNNEVFPISTPPKTAVFVPEKIREVDKLEVEVSEPELPPIKEKVVSHWEFSTDITQESENSLSEATELTPESETKFESLEEEDIFAILGELNNNQLETTPISVSPQVEWKSDRHNPHAIFDQMGKNMAYATAFDFGTIELEKLFDEFDQTLDQEEQVNQGNSVSQKQDDLELQQLFDQFDRSLEQQLRNSDVSEVQELVESNLTLTTANTTTPATDIELTTPTITPTSKLSDTKLDLNTLAEFYFKLNAFFFRTGINFISLISWLVNFLRTEIHFRPENSQKLSLSDIPDSNEQRQRKKVQVLDINGNYVTDEISSLILSNQPFNSIVELTSVDTGKPSQEILMETSNHRLIRESYSLSVGIQDFQKDNLISTSANSVTPQLLRQNPNEENLNENSSHPRKNDTS